MQRRNSSKTRLALENLEPRCMLTGYSVVDLGFLDVASDNGWNDNEWNDINNKGQVAGRAGGNAVLWMPGAAGGGTGSMVDLGKLPGDDVAIGETISSNGLVAGTSVLWAATANERHEPFLWIPDSPNGDTGSMLATGVIGGRAKGVNSHGKIVGDMGDLSVIPQAFIWERDANGDPQLTDLNAAVPREQLTAQGIESGVILYDATAINDSNQVVVNGWYEADTNGDGNSDVQKGYAFLLKDDNGLYYDGGITITHLGSLNGNPYTFATDINKSGQIVGASDSPARNHGRHAFLWQDGAMSDLGTMGRDTQSLARAISDNGTVVGESSGSMFVSSYKPFLWQNGRMDDLNKGLGKGSDWTLLWADGVNDDAQVVGTGIAPHTSDKDDWRGYYLTTDVTLPKLSIRDATVVEGDLDTLGNPELTTVELEVSLSASAAEAITVDYYTVGNWNIAIADEDFVNKSDSVTFQPGETRKMVTVQVKGDLLAGGATHDQGDEYFYVSLVNPRNEVGEQAAVLHDAAGNVTILEDEPSMSIGDIQLPEGDDDSLTPFTFTVSLSGPAKADVSVDWHTEDNTAKAGIDYEAASGTLVIPEGQSSGKITVQVIGDTVVEDTNPFVVVLHEETVQNAYITNGYGFGYIENDDGGGKKGGGRGKPNSTTVATTETLLDSQLEPLTNEQTTVQIQGKGKGNGGGGGNGGSEDPPTEPPALAFTDGKDIFVTDADRASNSMTGRKGDDGPTVVEEDSLAQLLTETFGFLSNEFLPIEFWRS